MDNNRERQVATDPAAFQDEMRIPSVTGARRFGQCMADFQRQRFASINPALLAIAKGQKPPTGKHWWEATKGASKDSDLAVCLLWLLAFSLRPLTCQVGAADADQAGELRKAAKDIVALNPWLSQRITVYGSKIVCNKGPAAGSECEIIASDVAGSHGARPDVLILNELSHVTKQEFGENLVDNAAKVPNGLVVIATNAGFTGTWQFKWRELARTSPRWSFQQYAQPSPWLDAADIEEAQQRNSQSRFMRLWHGIWASGSGDALDLEDIQAAIRAQLPMTGGEREFAFVAGLDLGVKNDHSALVVLAKHSSGLLRLASCKSWSPKLFRGSVDLEAVEQAVLEAHRRFRLSEVSFDPSQCLLMAQRLRKHGVPMVERPFTGKLLDEMASMVLNEFRSRNIEIYDEPLLIRDLKRLTIVEKSFGYKLESARDADGHADRAVSLALAMIASKSARATGQWGGVLDTGTGIAPSFDGFGMGRRTFHGSQPPLSMRDLAAQHLPPGPIQRPRQ